MCMMWPLFMYNEGAIDCMHLGTRRVDPSDVKIYGHIGHRNIEHAVIQGHMDMHAGTGGHMTIYRDIQQGHILYMVTLLQVVP